MPASIVRRSSVSRRQPGRTRGVRRSADLRDTLRAVRNGDTGRLGTTSATAALNEDAVQELVLTRCFLERDDDAAMRLMALAVEHAIKPIIVDGVAALELDLFGDGVAARLR